MYDERPFEDAFYALMDAVADGLVPCYNCGMADAERVEFHQPVCLECSLYGDNDEC